MAPSKASSRKATPKKVTRPTPRSTRSVSKPASNKSKKPRPKSTRTVAAASRRSARANNVQPTASLIEASPEATNATAPAVTNLSPQPPRVEGRQHHGQNDQISSSIHTVDALERAPYASRRDNDFDLQALLSTENNATPPVDITSLAKEMATMRDEMVALRANTSIASTPPQMIDINTLASELTALRAELAVLRAGGASRTASTQVNTTTNLSTVRLTGTLPDHNGLLPPPAIRTTSSADFGTWTKRSKAEYNPPPSHVTAAYRMFPGMTNGTYLSPSSLLHTVSTDESIEFDKSEAILMALCSGQIGRDGASILHFEAISASDYTDKAKQRRLLSDFSGNALLPALKRLESSQPPLSYAHILLAIEGLGSFTRSYCFDHINAIVDRIRVFVTKNAQHDKGSAPARVMLTLHTVDMFLSRALNHLRSDSASAEWLLRLSSLITSSTDEVTTSIGATTRDPPTRDSGHGCSIRGKSCNRGKRLHAWPTPLPEPLLEFIKGYFAPTQEQNSTTQNGSTSSETIRCSTPKASHLGVHNAIDPISLHEEGYAAFEIIDQECGTASKITCHNSSATSMAEHQDCTPSIDSDIPSPSTTLTHIGHTTRLNTQAALLSTTRRLWVKRTFEMRTSSTEKDRIWFEIRRRHLHRALRSSGLTIPVTSDPLSPDIIDTTLKSILSEFIRRTRPELHEFVELFRCQTADDYRPNKSILPSSNPRSCRAYPQLDMLLEYAENGVRVELSKPMPVQPIRPDNHDSAIEHLRILLRNLRAEQDAGRVLILDLDILEIWPHIHISPFGIVAKTGKDPNTHGRTIHDLSFPPELSVNDCTDQSKLPKPAYESCAAIVREILRQRRLERLPPKLLTGDVAHAFRHIGIHSKSVYLFGGRIPHLNLLVIDLCCPFGWTGSPSCYETFGAAITHRHKFMSPNARNPNFGYHWVDDHVCVALDNLDNCSIIEHSLRQAMISVLGADAINEAKFSGWHYRLKVLGLNFDTTAASVSIPDDKIQKARNLVAETYHMSSVSISDFRSLPGSLRHVATCLRPARAFLQRLREPERYLKRYRRVQVTEAMRKDLLWWWTILHQPVLNNVPMHFFHTIPEADFTIEVDASDYGCCAIDVTRKRYICYAYNKHELGQIAIFHKDSSSNFDINFRELLTCAFAASIWSAHWRENSFSELVHVHFRVDNMSAVSWQQKLSSRNPLAQDLIRLLCWWEVEHRIRFSASHTPGVDNVRADAGSRASVLKHKQSLFTNLTAGWTQDKPPFSVSTMIAQWRLISEITPLPTPRTTSRNGKQPKSNTIANILHGINHFFKSCALEFPLGHPQVCMLLKGLHRLDNPEERKAPVTLALLRAVFSRLDLTTPADQALWGTLCVAFFFLLRKSEIVADGTRFKWFILRHGDIQIRGQDGFPTTNPAAAASVSISLLGSKTNQNGPPTARTLSLLDDRHIFPVLGVMCMLRARGSLPQHFPAATFIQRGGGLCLILADRIVTSLREVAHQVGIDPRAIGTHSLRAGGATHMHRAGIETTTIQLHGRWASDAFKRYTRLCEDSVAVIAKSMVSGSASNASLV